MRSLRAADVHAVYVPVDHRSDIPCGRLHDHGASAAVDFYRNDDTGTLFGKEDGQLRRCAAPVTCNEGRQFFITGSKAGVIVFNCRRQHKAVLNEREPPRICARHIRYIGLKPSVRGKRHGSAVRTHRTEGGLRRPKAFHRTGAVPPRKIARIRAVCFFRYGVVRYCRPMRRR